MLLERYPRFMRIRTLVGVALSLMVAETIARRRTPRRDWALPAESSDDLASPFEPMLTGRVMPQAFMDEFMLPLDASHDVVHDGVMERVWSVRWFRPILHLLARSDTLFPENATDAPTTMHIFIGRDKAGRLCHYWNRTFRFPHRERRINAHLVWEPARRWVAEWMGPGDCLEMAWHVQFAPPSVIEIDARMEALRLGSLRIPLPRLMQLDAYTVDTADSDRDDHLRCELTLSNPLLGRMFGYEGAFQVSRIPRHASPHTGEAVHA